MVLAHHVALLNSKRLVRSVAPAAAACADAPAPPQVLASGSPRRKELLQTLVRGACSCAPACRSRVRGARVQHPTERRARGLPPPQGLRFEVHVSTFDETLDKSGFASAAGARAPRAEGSSGARS